MPTVNVPRKLSTLIELLRANGVTSFSDGNISLTFGPSALPRREEVEADHAGTYIGTPPAKGRPPHRAKKDAVALAIAGLNYDPNEDESSDFPPEPEAAA